MRKCKENISLPPHFIPASGVRDKMIPSSAREEHIPTSGACDKNDPQALRETII